MGFPRRACWRNLAEQIPTHESSISNSSSRLGCTVESINTVCLCHCLDGLVRCPFSADDEAWDQTRAFASLTPVRAVNGKEIYNEEMMMSIMRRIITFLSNPNTMEERRLFAAQTITFQLFHLLRVRKAVRTEQLKLFLPHVGTLVELLTGDVPTRIQQEVLRGLRFAIEAFTDRLDSRAALEIPRLLGRVVPFLASQETRSDAIPSAANLLRCRQSDPSVIRKVTLPPGCLETMVENLMGMSAQGEHVAADTGDHREQDAIRALGLIAEVGEGQIVERLAETPGLLEAIVFRLSKINTGVCLAAAPFVRSLSRDLHPSTSASIVEQEGCLGNLVRLLDMGVAEVIQTEALGALISLSTSSDIRVCHRILETESLLKKIVISVTIYSLKDQIECLRCMYFFP